MFENGRYLKILCLSKKTPRLTLNLWNSLVPISFLDGKREEIKEKLNLNMKLLNRGFSTRMKCLFLHLF